MAFPIPRFLLKTLTAVHSGLSTTKEIHAADDDGKQGLITVLAINRRLERLRKMGLVTRKQTSTRGKAFHYTATTKADRLIQPKGKSND